MRLTLKHRIYCPLNSSQRPLSAAQGTGGRLKRRLLQHVLPFLLMLMAISWLALKAANSIHQTKQPHSYATLADQ